MHKVLSTKQLCFLSKRSTVDAIIENFEELLQRKQQHKPIKSTLFPLSKAFGRVDHHLLLAKCEKHGLRGTVKRLLHSFLSNRGQFVLFSDNSSSMRDIIHGVTRSRTTSPSFLHQSSSNECQKLRAYLICRRYKYFWRL